MFLIIMKSLSTKPFVQTPRSPSFHQIFAPNLRMGPHLPAEFWLRRPKDHAWGSPLELELAAGHLGEVRDPIPPLSVVPVNFCFIKFSQKYTIWAAQTSRTTLWPPLTLGVGVPEWNVSYYLPGVDVVLHDKFEHCRSNSVAAFREQTHIRTEGGCVAHI